MIALNTIRRKSTLSVSGLVVLFSIVCFTTGVQDRARGTGKTHFKTALEHLTHVADAGTKSIRVPVAKTQAFTWLFSETFSINLASQPNRVTREWIASGFEHLVSYFLPPINAP